MAAALPQYGWILAVTTIAFVFSSFGNGANDVANSFATSVAARSLTMAQAGVISILAEFLGAVVLGSRVTNTIKNGIISLEPFRKSPSVLMTAMGSAEISSATWLMVATRLGFPVSTTHTIVGSLIGAGIGSQAGVTWSWKSGSVSQIAASWLIAPLIGAAFSATIFATLKFCVLERQDPFQKAMRAIPFYLAFTCAVLALFITVEAPTAASLEEMGAGTACAIVLGTFFGTLIIAYVFFLPYLHRVVVLQDERMRPWHIPMGPLLRRENPPLYWPGKGAMLVDHYLSTHEKHQRANDANGGEEAAEAATAAQQTAKQEKDVENPSSDRDADPPATSSIRPPGPHERFLAPVAHLPLYHPRRARGLLLFGFLQGVTRDCVTHSSSRLEAVHGKAPRYDNRIEHLWTYPQVLSAIMMSVAHGSNDVANAVGPWAAVYQTYETGQVGSRSPAPVWILAVAGFLLGAGFWIMGYHIVRSLGNKITQLSPTRGFAMELGAAITVLLASRLSLPISTTQTITGAVVGVSLMNLDWGATNWRQLAFIFLGWVLTLPVAGLLSGLLTAMALNVPQFV
ncbi:phosphate transporter family protein [Immersiella caudata]|uniref:Phosphate transporter n=1 Tax=Immersiella caudata TaxID=314043 RepID=A0AA39WQ42_9PEZI|nr:phosphate transporter family protein [Immersiella caudata]